MVTHSTAALEPPAPCPGLHLPAAGRLPAALQPWDLQLRVPATTSQLLEGYLQHCSLRTSSSVSWPPPPSCWRVTCSTAALGHPAPCPGRHLPASGGLPAALQPWDLQLRVPAPTCQLLEGYLQHCSLGTSSSVSRPPPPSCWRVTCSTAALGPPAPRPGRHLPAAGGLPAALQPWDLQLRVPATTSQLLEGYLQHCSLGLSSSVSGPPPPNCWRVTCSTPALGPPAPCPGHHLPAAGGLPAALQPWDLQLHVPAATSQLLEGYLQHCSLRTSSSVSRPPPASCWRVTCSTAAWDSPALCPGCHLPAAGRLPAALQPWDLQLRVPAATSQLLEGYLQHCSLRTSSSLHVPAATSQLLEGHLQHCSLRTSGSVSRPPPPSCWKVYCSTVALGPPAPCPGRHLPAAGGLPEALQPGTLQLCVPASTSQLQEGYLQHCSIRTSNFVSRPPPPSCWRVTCSTAALGAPAPCPGRHLPATEWLPAALQPWNLQLRVPAATSQLLEGYLQHCSLGTSCSVSRPPPPSCWRLTCSTAALGPPVPCPGHHLPAAGGLPAALQPRDLQLRVPAATSQLLEGYLQHCSLRTSSSVSWPPPASCWRVTCGTAAWDYPAPCPGCHLPAAGGLPAALQPWDLQLCVPAANSQQLEGYLQHCSLRTSSYVSRRDLSAARGLPAALQPGTLQLRVPASTCQLLEGYLQHCSLGTSSSVSRPPPPSCWRVTCSTAAWGPPAPCPGRHLPAAGGLPAALQPGTLQLRVPAATSQLLEGYQQHCSLGLSSSVSRPTSQLLEGYLEHCSLGLSSSVSRPPPPSCWRVTCSTAALGPPAPRPGRHLPAAGGLPAALQPWDLQLRVPAATSQLLEGYLQHCSLGTTSSVSRLPPPSCWRVTCSTPALVPPALCPGRHLPAAGGLPAALQPGDLQLHVPAATSQLLEGYLQHYSLGLSSSVSRPPPPSCWRVTCSTTAGTLQLRVPAATSQLLEGYLQHCSLGLSSSVSRPPPPSCWRVTCSTAALGPRAPCPGRHLPAAGGLPAALQPGDLQLRVPAATSQLLEGYLQHCSLGPPALCPVRHLPAAGGLPAALQSGTLQLRVPAATSLLLEGYLRHCSLGLSSSVSRPPPPSCWRVTCSTAPLAPPAPCPGRHLPAAGGLPAALQPGTLQLRVPAATSQLLEGYLQHCSLGTSSSASRPPPPSCLRVTCSTAALGPPAPSPGHHLPAAGGLPAALQPGTLQLCVLAATSQLLEGYLQHSSLSTSSSVSRPPPPSCWRVTCSTAALGPPAPCPGRHLPAAGRLPAALQPWDLQLCVPAATSQLLEGYLQHCSLGLSSSVSRLPPASCWRVNCSTAALGPPALCPSRHLPAAGGLPAALQPGTLQLRVPAATSQLLEGYLQHCSLGTSSSLSRLPPPSCWKVTCSTAAWDSPALCPGRHLPAAGGLPVALQPWDLQLRVPAATSQLLEGYPRHCSLGTSISVSRPPPASCWRVSRGIAALGAPAPCPGRHLPAAGGLPAALQPWDLQLRVPAATSQLLEGYLRHCSLGTSSSVSRPPPPSCWRVTWWHCSLGTSSSVSLPQPPSCWRVTCSTAALAPPAPCPGRHTPAAGGLPAALQPWDFQLRVPAATCQLLEGCLQHCSLGLSISVRVPAATSQLLKGYLRHCSLGTSSSVSRPPPPSFWRVTRGTAALGPPAPCPGRHLPASGGLPAALQPWDLQLRVPAATCQLLEGYPRHSSLSTSSSVSRPPPASCWRVTCGTAALGPPAPCPGRHLPAAGGLPAALQPWDLQFRVPAATSQLLEGYLVALQLWDLQLHFPAATSQLLEGYLQHCSLGTSSSVSRPPPASCWRVTCSTAALGPTAPCPGPHLPAAGGLPAALQPWDSPSPCPGPHLPAAGGLPAALQPWDLQLRVPAATCQLLEGYLQHCSIRTYSSVSRPPPPSCWRVTCSTAALGPSAPCPGRHLPAAGGLPGGTAALGPPAPCPCRHLPAAGGLPAALQPWHLQLRVPAATSQLLEGYLQHCSLGLSISVSRPPPPSCWRVTCSTAALGPPAPCPGRHLPAAGGLPAALQH
ncbi:hypothetical protein NDU88_001476 [Pleurodeles waltl]|uniref:Uncharacterized protein n=1 Tax=Pleurodeles waltl TaxID=8319 RepID=A0AAV7UUS9_PLEWA|nr:hypothetical protein NDU88_001476 [Pleurodeles waltl]